MALGPDMGVAVNRYLYKALAERDAHVWKYQGKYPDGYLGPDAEELQGQRAMWDYSPALKPNVTPRALATWEARPTHLVAHDHKVMTVDLTPKDEV